MAEYRGLTASMATLAIFARSANTLAGAQAELTEWPGARWPRNTAHKHVPTHVDKGRLRPIALGRERSLDWYEITSRGESHRLGWLRSHAVGLAAVERDSALGKIELCNSLEDVLVVIQTLEAEEAMYEQAYGDAHGRSLAARRARLRSPERGSDLRARLRDIGIAGEAALWDATVKRLYRTRRELETLQAELRGVPG